MKTSILSPAHSGVVPSVCDAEAGDTPHDPASGIASASAREQASPPDELGQADMNAHWYTFWKRSPRRALGRKNIQ